MSVNSNQQDIQGDPQLELKAGSFTLPVLRLLGTDMDAAARQLALKVEQAAGFFHNAPVVVDLTPVAQEGVEVEFPLLVGLMRGYGMVPVGVRGGTQTQNAAAEAMELAILADTAARRPGGGQQAPRRPAPARPAASQASAKMVTRPVRSGQRVYAPGGDLIVLAQVSSGAEIMADGHIHAYGTLRGRALAGVKGNREARIFCHDLQAELVSVAGHYRISENMDAALKGQAVQVFLQDRTLHLEPM